MFQILMEGDNMLLVLAIVATILGIYFYYRHLRDERTQQNVNNEDPTIDEQPAAA